MAGVVGLIAAFDNLLRHLFLSAVPQLTDEDQVRFQPPDADWRTYVSNLTVGGQPANALSVYLVELRENRKLRSNERHRSYESGVTFDRPAPRRIDCHYLISAWSPATTTPAIEPTLDEVGLLYEASAALLNAQPIVPSEVYAPDPVPATFPAQFAGSEIPTTVLPVEGFPKYAEFWGTMGQTHPWRPALYLVATLPVVLAREQLGPIVTTRITEYRRPEAPSDRDVWVEIGGAVATSAGQVLERAWVGIETPAADLLQSTLTDEGGHFTFARLSAGSYRLHARAEGLGDVVRDIDVPSFSGEYDLTFP
ncbi:MAG TPA: Pvc16 family protein [Candidatus Limnocylindrales bacterium]|nr:Pvc16 family protein [Candidatus Limnocylindrales bacterium]